MPAPHQCYGSLRPRGRAPSRRRVRQARRGLHLGVWSSDCMSTRHCGNTASNRVREQDPPAHVVALCTSRENLLKVTDTRSARQTHHLGGPPSGNTSTGQAATALGRVSATEQSHLQAFVTSACKMPPEGPPSHRPRASDPESQSSSMATERVLVQHGRSCPHSDTVLNFPRDVCPHHTVQ